MARKKARSRRRARKAHNGRPAAAGPTTLGLLMRSGWSRFASGIAIGLVLGVGAAFYLGGFDLLLHDNRAVKVTTLNASPVEEQAALPPKPAPPKPVAAPTIVERVVESAPSRPRPQGEEARRTPAPTPAGLPTPMRPAAAAETSSGQQAAAIAPAPPAYVDSDMTWLKNAVAFPVPRGRPLIAIVLDDVGVVRSHAQMAIDLPGAVTLSFMTYADGVAEMAARARANGHELMLHVPMQPLDGDLDAGPQALTVGLSEEELLKRLAWGLDRFSGYVGINNHMGSRFTQDERGMRIVLDELKRRGLLFLDSRTINTSVGDKLAARMGVAHVVRDVFLDDEMSEAAVMSQLAFTERVAASKGHAIAIGHPHPATLAALRAWMPKAEARGFVIVPLSAIARLRLGVSG